ncbi:hypothetical protein JCM19274_4088 [Algibacter lectus]|uniref:Uncharacterized protein n=1 Tax=Algibacter lectus TaxID=221126 RepID=A0A090X2N1_9FLAO|nr:hypothetical protein JCM19274_4088 [Algibacter lectus]
MANEKPNIPITGANPPFDAASTSKVPTIGPVQENDTMARANAIKKIPTSPPRSACESTLLAQEFGNIISKAPKKETAKTTNNIKKMILNQTLVASAFKASAPKIPVTAIPNNKYITMIQLP